MSTASAIDDKLTARGYRTRVARFDDKAIAELFRSYGALVYRRAYRLLGNADDAQEATQEVFVRVLRSDDGDRGRGTTGGWLAQITTNYCLNLLRDRTRRRELMAQHGPNPEPTSAEANDLTTLRYLLAHADPDQARAAVLVYLDGMSYSEAAERLGVSKRTVGNWLDRFRAWAEPHVRAPGRTP